MKKNIIATAVAMALVLPVTADAAKVLGDELEVYGKLHLSVDASDTDGLNANKEDISISSNSSRLGFKGKHKIANGGMSVVYQLEQEVAIGDGKDGGSTLVTRNSFAGLKGSFGQVIVGYHDTQFKTVGSKWGVFGDSVGERRAILGAGALSGNKMNQRGKNALMWTKKIGNLKAMAMYSADSSKTEGKIDNNDNVMTSVGVLYKGKGIPFYFGAAYEDWDNLTSTIGATDGYRVMAGYKAGFGKIGFIYEDITSVVADMDRSVYGVNGVFKLGSGLDIRGQILVADDYQGVANSGATKIGLGLFKKMDKQTQLYAAYGQTDNDINAKYQGVDGGHGDEVKTVKGGTPNSFSLGLVYKF
ncbi:MAG: porin [Gammaproteobacteria bacterium]|nr:porin [Gammaproteobacteria bacterium]